jgi:CRISPR/Cas system-associated exonuclease Cas4 (RecB family)
VNPLFWIKPPVEPASPPRRWSYSSLAAWRQCPRQWWLRRGRYDNTPDGAYPTVFGAATIKGRLVHEALEAFQSARRDSEQEGRFDARRFIKQRLRELLDGEVAANPRLDAGRLQAAFSIDECMARFFTMARRVGPPTWQYSDLVFHVERGDSAPLDAEEFWVETNDPPLSGRLDRVRRGVIVEFKTGEEKNVEHEAQVRFYATLWWLRYRRVPEGLELHYFDEVRRLLVPGSDTLTAEADGLRAEIATIESELNQPPPVARPTVEACQYCAVRQLCDEFWVSPATEKLRRPDAETTGEGVSVFRDVRLTKLPANWAPGRPLTGTAAIDGFGQVEVALASKYCPSAGEKSPTECRLLQVLLRHRDGAWTLRGVASSEAFWSV